MARIHFVGINGVGINALAKFASDMGFETSGSDAHLGALAKDLRGDVYEGMNPAAVDGASMLVHTVAAGDDHPEIARARELGIPVLPRQKMLGEVSALFERSIAVAGTHGKTTTTAMITHILRAADKKFAAMIGGEGVDFSNYVNNRLVIGASEQERLGFVRRCAGETCDAYVSLQSKILAGGGIFVAEACEYMRSFLCLKPYVGVITNVEFDHPDCYASLADVKEAFEEFSAQSKIKICESKRLKDEKFAISLYGEGINARIALLADGGITTKGKRAATLSLPLGGEYNLRNAMFAICATYAMGVDIPTAAEALATFAGVKRRFEHAKNLGQTKVYFDFAHHPTELACAFARARSMGRTLAVFQPHTFSRTRAYLNDFAEVLGEGDGALILMPTYAARERSEGGDCIEALAEAIGEKYPLKKVILAASHADALEKTRELADAYDVVLMLGAGDIYAIKDML